MVPEVVVEGGVRVDPGDRTVLGAVDLVETADGTLWVSWVSEDADGWRQAFVVRSADGGASFGAPIQVVSDGEPLSGWPRRARLNARDDRVFVSMSVFESPWTFADLYISDSASQTATFTLPWSYREALAFWEVRDPASWEAITAWHGRPWGDLVNEGVSEPKAPPRPLWAAKSSSTCAPEWVSSFWSPSTSMSLCAS